MPCDTDRYFLAYEVEEEAGGIRRGSCEPIVSAWGHRAGDPHRPGQAGERAFIRAQVEALLGR